MPWVLLVLGLDSSQRHVMAPPRSSWPPGKTRGLAEFFSITVSRSTDWPRRCRAARDAHDRFGWSFGVLPWWSLAGNCSRAVGLFRGRCRADAGDAVPVEFFRSCRVVRLVGFRAPWGIFRDASHVGMPADDDRPCFLEKSDVRHGLASGAEVALLLHAPWYLPRWTEWHTGRMVV